MELKLSWRENNTIKQLPIFKSNWLLTNFIYLRNRMQWYLKCNRKKNLGLYSDFTLSNAWVPRYGSYKLSICFAFSLNTNTFCTFSQLIFILLAGPRCTSDFSSTHSRLESLNRGLQLMQSWNETPVLFFYLLIFQNIDPVSTNVHQC